MIDRQYTRIDYVRQYLDEMLKNCADKETGRNGYVHLYGVGQACALIALFRGHAEKSSGQARRILADTRAFTEEEIEMVCQAIGRHSNKKQVDGEFDEILKDADEMQHWLRNPAEEYFFHKERTQKIAKELGLI